MSNIFNKTDAQEIINVGDLIMLDIKTGLVTVSKSDSKEDYLANNNLIVRRVWKFR